MSRSGRYGGNGPVIVRDIDNPLEAERVIIESNRQREKTASEVMHEADNIERIEEEKSRRRQLAGLKQGANTPVVANLPQREKGKTRDKVAEQVGRKTGTFRNIQTVWEAANDETAPQPVRAVAQEQMTALDTKAAMKRIPRLPRRWRVCGKRLTTWGMKRCQ